MAHVGPQHQRKQTHYIGGWVGPRAGLNGRREEKKILLLLEFEPQTFHPLASICTDYAVQGFL